MENDNLKILRSVPNIILKNITTKTNETIEEYKFEWLTKVFVQEYSDYNMVVLKTNVFDEQLSNIREVESLILDECIYDINTNPVDCKQCYSNMKLLLTFRESKCKGGTELYHIFASENIKENSLKKELNWLLDREINQSITYNLNNISDIIRDSQNEIKDTNIELANIRQSIYENYDKKIKKGMVK